ncbi:MAG: hydrogenase nickel incorporation protein HypB [Kiritimatiellae bacterium]|nr:hydrogenase nickel incorporation protein HypB [Kiritimatiellia bacterium]
MKIKVYRDLMGDNDRWAAKTRVLLAKENIKMLNLIGSPGAGKTALLEKTVRKLSRRLDFAVLEGDLETKNDARRLARLNCRVSQLLTGGGCHLEAKMVHYAVRDLPLRRLDMIIVENVGNLVCPAEFDIGEHAKAVAISVTEGDDKPLKYPLIFREAGAVVITKTDLLPHVPFRLKKCLGFIRKLNPRAPVFQVSALNGNGLGGWINWLACAGGFVPGGGLALKPFR